VRTGSKKPNQKYLKSWQFGHNRDIHKVRAKESVIAEEISPTKKETMYFVPGQQERHFEDISGFWQHPTHCRLKGVKD
jgi:hypothetical protein